MSETTGTRSRSIRLLSEALVIFAGVGLALVADDWRETRGDREEAARSLELIERDLVRDSAQIEEARTEVAADLVATGWLLGHWTQPGAATDSILVHLGELRASARPAFSRAGFEGLRASNGLRLLRSGELRDSLLQYYEVTQPQFAEYYFEVVWPRRGVVNASLSPHVESFRWVDMGELALRTSWSDLTSDPAVETELAAYHGASTYSVEAMAELGENVERLLDGVRLGISGRKGGSDRAPPTVR